VTVEAPRLRVPDAEHGISTGAVLLFGILYERRHTRLLADYGGIAKVMPFYATAFLIITFSSIAVPDQRLRGEFWCARHLQELALAVLGAGLAGGDPGAAYMLWLVQRVFFGQLTTGERPPPDMNCGRSSP